MRIPAPPSKTQGAASAAGASSSRPGTTGGPAHVQVVMMRDVQSGRWIRHAEWSDNGTANGSGPSLPPQTGKSKALGLPADHHLDQSSPRFHTPRRAHPQFGLSVDHTTANVSPQRGTFGQSPRPCNDPLPPLHNPSPHGEASKPLTPSQRKRKTIKEKELKSAATKMLNDFDLRVVPRSVSPNPYDGSASFSPSDLREISSGSFSPRSPLNAPVSSAAIDALSPNVSGGLDPPSGKKGTMGSKRKIRPPSHPIIGLLCQHTPPQIVHAFMDFSIQHTMPSIFGVGNTGGQGWDNPLESGGGLGGSVGPTDSGTFVVSPSGNSPTSGGFMPTPKDVMKKMESGWFFYVHPDGLTAPQFKFLLPHFTEGTGVSVGSAELADSMFRTLCREQTRKLPFCDIFQLVTDALLPVSIRQNVEFVLQCFDPYNIGKVPNHMFYSSFFAKFLRPPGGAPSPVPSSSRPQWELLLQTLIDLESNTPSGTNVAHNHSGHSQGPRSKSFHGSPSSSREGQQQHFPALKTGGLSSATAATSKTHSSFHHHIPITDEDRQRFSWLRESYLNAQNNYKTFSEKMSLMLSTIRAKIRQGGSEVIATSVSNNGSANHPNNNSSALPQQQTSGSGFGDGSTGGPASGGFATTSTGKQHPATVAITYAEAKVLLLGTPCLYALFQTNSFIFYKPPTVAAGSDAFGSPFSNEPQSPEFRSPGGPPKLQLPGGSGAPSSDPIGRSNVPATSFEF